MEDETLKDAFGVWRDLSRSREETLAYESRLKYILDEEAKLGDARYFAEKKGIEQGIDQTMNKIAKKMIGRGDSNEEIMDMTDLTLEEIEALRAHIQQKS